MTTPFVPLHTNDPTCVSNSAATKQAWARPDDIAGVEVDAVRPRGHQTNAFVVRVTLGRAANGQVHEFVFASPDDDPSQAHAAAEAHAVVLMRSCDPQAA